MFDGNGFKGLAKAVSNGSGSEKATLLSIILFALSRMFPLAL